MSKNLRLKNKIALVTGGGSGIGRAASILMAREGASVIVSNDKNIQAGKETVEIIKSENNDAAFLRCDVSNSGEVQKLFSNIQEKYGCLDILFANAGITNYIELEEIDESIINSIIDINLKGCLFCAKYAIPLLKKSGRGSIVFCSSVLNMIGLTGAAPYCASKAGIIGIMNALAVELGKYNIRVNCVSPGAINTPMRKMDECFVNENTDLNKLRQNLCASNALGRIAEPEEVANAVVWLSSEEASYITGANLFIDGAYTVLKR